MDLFPEGSKTNGNTDFVIRARTTIVKVAVELGLMAIRTTPDAPITFTPKPSTPYFARSRGEIEDSLTWAMGSLPPEQTDPCEGERSALNNLARRFNLRFVE
jgi:hypothetical protein